MHFALCGLKLCAYNCQIKIEINMGIPASTFFLQNSVFVEVNSTDKIILNPKIFLVENKKTKNK